MAGLQPDGGVVKTEQKAYPWHGAGSATYQGGADYGGYQAQSAGVYTGARAGGRVGVADWESVSVVSDLDKSLAQDATKMGGLNDKLAKYVKFTSSLEQNNKDLHEQLMAARAELQRLRADLETRPTSQRYDSLITERDELNKRLRDLMAPPRPSIAARRHAGATAPPWPGICRPFRLAPPRAGSHVPWVGHGCKDSSAESARPPALPRHPLPAACRVLPHRASLLHPPSAPR